MYVGWVPLFCIGIVWAQKSPAGTLNPSGAPLPAPFLLDFPGMHGASLRNPELPVRLAPPLELILGRSHKRAREELSISFVVERVGSKSGRGVARRPGGDEATDPRKGHDGITGDTVAPRGGRGALEGELHSGRVIGCGASRQ